MGWARSRLGPGANPNSQNHGVLVSHVLTSGTVFRVENAVRGWLQAQGIDVSTLVGSHCTSVDMWTVSLYFLGVFSDRLDPGGFAVHGCMCSLCIYCCIQHRGGTKSAYVATLPTVYEYGHMRHTAPSTNFPTSCFC
jgi:hypothetical protein